MERLITAQSDHVDAAGPALIVMMGLSGSGKSTWARSRYPGERLCALEAMRDWVSQGGSRSRSAERAAKRALREVVKARLELGHRAVVDAPSLDVKERRAWLDLAKELGAPTQLVWCDLSPEEAAQRGGFKASTRHLERQRRRLGSKPAERIEREPWDALLRVAEHHAPGQAEVIRAYEPPLWRELPSGGARLVARQGGGYDVVGDVHGCAGELDELASQLGWRRDQEGAYLHQSEPQRQLVFLGDLTDRGPDSLGVLRRVAATWRAGRARLVRGNHDDKLLRHLRGNRVKVDGALSTTLKELEEQSSPLKSELIAEALQLLEAAPYWIALGLSAERFGGAHAEVILAHAAFKPELFSDDLDHVAWYCLYGPSTGQKDERGYPERLDWRERYPPDAPRCVTGHTPFHGEPRWHKKTLCLDTACVFGHRLTAWRWPEDEFVSVEADRAYCARATLEAAPRFARPGATR